MKKQKSLEEIVGNQPIFFKPNTEMVKWIIKYANNRIIIDAGSGKKFLLSQQLIKNGAKKVIAVDLDIDMNEMMKLRMMHQELLLNISFHVLPGDINKFKDFYSGDQKMLMIFARPCHSDWVEKTLNNKGKNVEALYITVPENLEKYDDLGTWRKKSKLLKHEGSSADKEVVYSIK